MIAYLCFSVLCFLIIFFVGFLSFFLVKRISSFDSKPDFLSVFFLGLVTLSVVTSYVSIVIPINAYLIIGYAFVAVVGVILLRKEFLNYLLLLKRPSILDYSIIALLSLFFLLLSARGIFNYDSALYHVQAINWTSDYPVVPGLGNLHSRLAYNSLFFTLSSVFSVNGVYGGHEYLLFPLNTISLIVFFIWQYFNFKSYVKEREVKRVAFVIIITLLVLKFLLKSLSSPSPDIICTIIILIVFQKITFEKFKNFNKSMFVVALVTVCISFKLSSLFLGLVILLLIRKKQIRSDVTKIGLLITFILLPFLIRNYYLSGYLIFPFAGIDIFNPEWKVPISYVQKETALIKAWAIIPVKSYTEVLSLSFAEWFPIWVDSKRTLVQLLILSSFATLIIGLIQWIKKRFKSFQICIILFANFLFWFFSAPDPRFAYGLLFFSFAYVAYLVVSIFHKTMIKSIIATSLIVLMLSFTWRTIKSVAFNTMYWYKIHPDTFTKPCAFESSKPESYESFTTNFQYFKPQKSDKCYNTKQPCTPYPKDDLFLRGKDLKDGFLIKNLNNTNK